MLGRCATAQQGRIIELRESYRVARIAGCITARYTHTQQAVKNDHVIEIMGSGTTAAVDVLETTGDATT